MKEVMEIFSHTLMITSFIFVMMLVIEYVNIITSGAWRERLSRSRIGQYLVAAFLGALPGCLGSFMVVTMYIHCVVSFGALLTAMIATVGDEAFLMLALMPKQAVALTALLVVLGVAAGFVTDLILKNRNVASPMQCEGLQIHEPYQCDCYPSRNSLQQLKKCTLARGVLILAIVLIMILLLTNQFELREWGWAKVTVLVSLLAALFIVTTVPDHFLEEHLWEHIAKKHVPRIFLWTLGAFVVLHLLVQNFHVKDYVNHNQWIMLLVAAAAGIIPESGPHMIFITMYAQGIIPFSVLFVNSMVQDGHGMIPLLAHSRKDFILIKAAKLLPALLLGYAMMLMGY